MPSIHIKDPNWDPIKDWQMECTVAKDQIVKATDLLNLMLEKEVKKIKKMNKSEREIYFKEL